MDQQSAQTSYPKVNGPAKAANTPQQPEDGRMQDMRRCAQALIAFKTKRGHGQPAHQRNKSENCGQTVVATKPKFMETRRRRAVNMVCLQKGTGPPRNGTQKYAR